MLRAHHGAMSTCFFPRGKERFLNKEIDYDTDTIRLMMLDQTVADTQVKAITGCTVATPAVITATAHGGNNGDMVIVRGVGGTTTVNQRAFLANVTANTFTLKTLDGNLDVVGVGAYTSGGTMLNLTQAITLDLINGGRVADGSGTDITLAGKTQTLGVIDANDVACTNVTGTVHAVVLYAFVTNDAASLPLIIVDGKIKVRVAADAASSATTLWCDPLPGPRASGTTLALSNGVTATLSGAAAAGATSLAVSALSGAVASNHQADVGTTSNGYGATYAGNAVTHQWDNGANRIIVI